MDKYAYSFSRSLAVQDVPVGVEETVNVYPDLEGPGSSSSTNQRDQCVVARTVRSIFELDGLVGLMHHVFNC